MRVWHNTLMATLLSLQSFVPAASAQVTEQTLVFASEVWPGLLEADGTGLFPDLLQAALPDHTFIIQRMPFQRAHQMLDQTLVTGVLGTYSEAEANRVPGRQHRITNQVPLAEERVIALCKPGMPANWHHVMHGQRYAWVRGYYYDVHFNIPQSELVNSTIQGLRMLLAGRLDCLVDDASDIRKLAASEPLSIDEYRQWPVATRSLYVSFLDTDADLAARLDAGLLQLHKTGHAASLYARWQVALPKIVE